MASARTTFDVDLDRDVRAVAAMAEHLTPYIYESELYGIMPGDLPRLTVGGLLMRLHRLRALRDRLSAGQQATVNQAQARFDAARSEWSVAYEKKIAQELKARLTSLAQFVQECAENPRGCPDNYPSAMEKRVIVELLKGEAEARNAWTDDLNGTLLSVDNQIRRVAEKGDFAWDNKVAAAYPRDQFWFLWAMPRRPGTKQ